MKVAAVQLVNRCGDPQASFAAAKRFGLHVGAGFLETDGHDFAHDGWLHAGSPFSRKVLGPLDTALDTRHYRSRVKVLRARR